MRRVLVLGGTGWVGREFVQRAVADGSDVVCLARGESGPVPDGARLVRADRHDVGAYDDVTGDWDEVVEFAYDPYLVQSALDSLAERAAHWTLVSSVSVYARNDEPDADESAELVTAKDLTKYPDAKVAAERASSRRLGDRLLIARPGLIVGPGDPSDRFGYWAARFGRGGRVVVPTSTGRFVQVIDVADLAVWMLRVGRDRFTGPINAVGPVWTMDHFFREVQAVTGFEGEAVEVNDAALLAQDVRYWAGPRSLPLWLPEPDSAFSQRNRSAFVSSGGVSTPIRETLARTFESETALGLGRTRRSGLTSREEEIVFRNTRNGTQL